MAMTAIDIMTSPAVFVTPDTNMAEIASLLASRHYSSVPVCYPDHTLAGMVSEGEILKPFRESVRARRDWALGVIAEGEAMTEDFLDYIRRDTRTAADVMVRGVVTVQVDTTLPELGDLMIKHGVKRLPVLRDGKIIGIVSRTDLDSAVAGSSAMLV
jgi:CBS domain-containing protein